MIMHGHMKQVVQDQARSAVNFHEPPESLAVDMPETLLGDFRHQADEKSDGLGQEEPLLTVRPRVRQPVLLLFHSDIERGL